MGHTLNIQHGPDPVAIVKLENGLIYLAAGTVPPTDGTAGFGVGCIFIHTDGSAGTTLYANEGTATSCDFDAISVA